MAPGGVPARDCCGRNARPSGGFLWLRAGKRLARRLLRCGFLSDRLLTFRVRDEGVDAVPAPPGSPVDCKELAQGDIRGVEPNPCVMS